MVVVAINPWLAEPGGGESDTPPPPARQCTAPNSARHAFARPSGMRLDGSEMIGNADQHLVALELRPAATEIAVTILGARRDAVADRALGSAA